MKRLALAILLVGAAHAAEAAETFTVAPREIADQKAVFATVESVKTVPARARIGGTVGSLTVREGDIVAADQVLAIVADEKLSAQLQALEAQAAKARADLRRAEDLAARGVLPRAQLDGARAAADVAESQLDAQRQRLTEGRVLAPAAGRVLRVPVTAGSVVLPGDPIAVLASEDYLLRLRLPERHARYLKAGDTIRLSREGAAETAGTIRLVYPEIEEGRVVADADVEGLGDYFVGERVRVLVESSPRTAFIVPLAFVATRFGTDYVTLERPGGETLEVPVQRGIVAPAGDASELELLSGVRAGDVLVRP
ncbi:MAG: efflux RND transporter periplasmic adaptor subunit [Alphaproteobacteria bacterium]|nr:efflux RND transporter periplasmic adaptor subunit [Alphaproteobacteria bacterium]